VGVEGLGLSMLTWSTVYITDLRVIPTDFDQEKMNSKSAKFSITVFVT